LLEKHIDFEGKNQTVQQVEAPGETAVTEYIIDSDVKLIENSTFGNGG